MSPGAFIAITLAAIVVVAFLIWFFEDEPTAMYDEWDEREREAHRSEAEHPSERAVGKMPELAMGFDPAREGADRSESVAICGECKGLIRPHRLFGTTCDCLVPKGTPMRADPDDISLLEETNPSPDFTRLRILSRVNRTGHATEEEKRELHELRLRFGRFEEVVQ